MTTLYFTTDSKQITDNELLESLYEFTHIEKVNEDVEIPLPWDAGFEIKEEGGIKILQLDGGAGPCGFGSATVKVPLENNTGLCLVFETTCQEAIEQHDEETANRLIALQIHLEENGFSRFPR